jgi:hypothetical protein
VSGGGQHPAAGVVRRGGASRSPAAPATRPLTMTITGGGAVAQRPTTRRVGGAVTSAMIPTRVGLHLRAHRGRREHSPGASWHPCRRGDDPHAGQTHGHRSGQADDHGVARRRCGDGVSTRARDPGLRTRGWRAERTTDDGGESTDGTMSGRQAVVFDGVDSWMSLPPTRGRDVRPRTELDDPGRIPGRMGAVDSPAGSNTSPPLAAARPTGRRARTSS